MLRSAIFGILCLLFVPTLGKAATFEDHEPGYLNCILNITGPIRSGDLETLKTKLSRLAQSGRYPDMMNFAIEGEDGALEFTGWRHRLCLNSPGGNYAEALRIADFIHGRIGTAIARDAECLSACSIIFMAGSVDTQSPDGIAPNRVLHAGGTLGFHAPALTVPDQNYQKTVVEQAYNLSNQGIAALLSRSAAFTIPVSLVTQMLRTPPDQMYMIDTPFKAGRWYIAVVGTVRPRKITQLAVSNACNTMYHFMGVSPSATGFGYEPSFMTRRGWRADITPTKNGSHDASLIGFGDDADLTCHLTIHTRMDAHDSNTLWDRYADMRLGDSRLKLHLSPAMFYNSQTKLSALARRSDTKVSYRAPAPEVTEHPRQTGLCFVFNGNKKLDEEPCTRTSTTTLHENLETDAQTSFLWPSGATTALREFKGNLYINRTPAQRITRQKPIAPAACSKNLTTGHTFCFKAD